MKMAPAIGSKSILLVEDSPEDVEITLRGLRRAGLANPIRHVGSGDEALDFLYHRGAFSDATAFPYPGLILLDLNLPGTDGHEVLETVKKDAALRIIPIIVMTTSDDDRDIEQSYLNGANSYIQKPIDLRGFLDAIQKLTDYWLEVTILPKVSGRPKGLSEEAAA